MSDFERYDRQIRVPGFGDTAQQQLNAARIVVVGAGGLGFAVASILAGAGVGYIRLIDFDLVSLTNLHRQWLYTEHDLGQAKANVLANHLKKLNSDIVVEFEVLRVSPDNAADLISDTSLVVDAADNMPTSYLLSDITQGNGVALVSASVNQRYGYVGTFCAAGLPSFRAVFPKVANELTTCDLVGVSGAAVTVMAGLQAQAAIDWLTDNANSLAGKILYADLKRYSLNLLDCSSALEPEGAKIELISAAQLQRNDWVVDVRELDEITDVPQMFSVDQACPLSGFAAHMISADKAARTVIACKSGQRAMIAAQQLLNAGQQAVAVVLPTATS